MALIADWLEAELRNWAAECLSGHLPHPMPPDRAMSLEGRYIRDSHLEKEAEQEEQIERPPKPDIDKAAIVQSVYKNLLTDDEKVILVERYIGKYDQGRYVKVDGKATAKRLHMSAAKYDKHLLMAAMAVGRAFRNGQGRIPEECGNPVRP